MTELTTDLADGIKLGTLLEIISNDKIKLNMNPKIDIQKLENINKSLQYLKDKGFALVNIGAMDVFKSNEKIILGLLWTIILRFEVGDQEGKNGLLLWVQRTCKGYREVDPPNVQNFSSDWNTGLPFCAIIHKFRPDLLDYSQLSAGNAQENCELAFSVAEEKLGIARMLDVQDVANHPRPDDKSIIAYVVQFFKLFAKANKNEALLKSIRTAVEVTKRHDALMEKYDLASKQLHSFCIKPKGTSVGRTTAQVKQELEAFTQYMRTEKPAMQALKAELEGAHAQLVNSKRNNGRPAFEPVVPLHKLNEEWAALELTEQQLEQSLLDKYQRFQQVDYEASTIVGGSARLISWAEEHSTKFSDPESVPTTLTALESELEVQDGFDSRLGQYGQLLGKFSQSGARVQELSNGEHQDEEKIAVLLGELEAKLVQVQALAGEFRSRLEQKYAEEKQAVLAERSFARTLDAVDFDLDQLETEARLPIVVSSAADVEAQTAKLAGELEQSLAEAQRTLDAELLPAATGALAQRRQFADSAAKLGEKLARVGGLLGERKASLHSLLEQERGRDALRAQFAAKANALAAELASLNQQLGGVTGELESQLEQIRALENKLAGTAPVLAEVDALAVQSDEAGIVHNPQTPHTVFSLRAQYDQVGKGAQEEYQAISAQVLAKKSLEATPEQLKEIAEVFAFFDQDNTGVLHLQELQEACTAAGVDLAPEVIEQKMKQRQAKMEFTLTDFTDFMLAELKAGGGDTPEAVIQALKQLGDGLDKLSAEQLQQAFQSEPVLRAYLEEKMVDGDIVRFVQELFSR